MLGPNDFLRIDHLKATDPEVASAVEGEYHRQAGQLEMIASENFTSPSVLEAQGSVMTNKYAEGYPSRRYYGGCEHVDVVERLAIERAKQLFGCEAVNVQPHAGSQANSAVYFALLKPGDDILGMDLAHGGHLTHGMKINFSGKMYVAHGYQVDRETELVDYDALREKALAIKPKLLIGGWSAYPRILDFAKLREIADEAGAIFMVDMAHFAGLVAGGVHPSPVPHAHIVTTTTHKTLRGPRAGMIMSTEEYAAPINKSVFPGMQGGPLMHAIAAKAVALKEAQTPAFKVYAKRIVDNAKVLGEGLVEGGLRLVTGGTDTHCLLTDLTALDVSGRQAENALEEAGITTNKNMIPFDQRKPMEASGIRLGTAALTTRGMGPDEMKTIAGWITAVLKAMDDEATSKRVKAQVTELCDSFPLHQPVSEQTL